MTRALCPDTGPSDARHVPRAPLPLRGVTSPGVASWATSEGVTPPSSLLRAHASDQNPPTGFRFLIPVGLRRLLPAPAGSWPFPTLSPQSLHRCLDPYPAASLRCSYPFLPEGLRPHLRAQRFGTPQIRHNATSTARRISGLQSFAYVQAPMLARPPGCTHR